MNNLYFFKLYVFKTIIYNCFNAKNVFKLNRLNMIEIIENIIFYIEFFRRIDSYILYNSTVDVAY